MKTLTWKEAQAQAQRIMDDLSRHYSPESIRLVLRALSRLHHKQGVYQSTLASKAASE